jgi:arylsulfatase A-like enzyme
LKAVQDLGLGDNTVVLFTSDHGDWMGDHGLWMKGAVHTRGVTRIPLIARWPGVSVPGRQVNGPASLVDLMPTILDAAGIEAPYGVQGRSLRPVLNGAAEQLRPYALIEHRHEPRRINGRFEKEARVINKTDQEWRLKSIVTDRFRLSYVPTENYGELYDIIADPDERNDLWDSQPALRQELLLQMLDALIESEDPLPERIWAV